MRARELLETDYSNNLESDLTNLLVAAKGAGSTQLKTSKVVAQLYAMGYSVTANSLLPLLSRNPAVMNATPEMINMTQPEVSQQGAGISPQDSAARVSDMASKATKIG